jgi:beta-1,4-N-acetylglucosaminyltransferase
MKIALVCSHGGHLTEMLQIIEAVQDHKFFFITYKSPRTEKLKYEKYLIRNIGINPLFMLIESFNILKILLKEKPNTIMSTGSEIAIPVLYLGKILGKKTIYIESWCRITTSSGTGRIVYPISDIFLVQWPELLELYGPKAQYKGAVI